MCLFICFLKNPLDKVLKTICKNKNVDFLAFRKTMRLPWISHGALRESNALIWRTLVELDFWHQSVFTCKTSMKVLDIDLSFFLRKKDINM